MRNEGSREPSATPRKTPLGWLGSLLWPGSSGVTVSNHSRSGSSRPAWWILPSTAAPRLLVPVGGPSTAVSLRQFNDSLSTVSRLRKVAVGVGLRVVGGRLRSLEQLTPPATASADLIGSHLPSLFGLPEVDVAISIGRELRPNLKPVLHVMNRRGRTLGYAKLGWNDVTKALVENEARVLRAWGSTPPHSFHVPEVIHDGAWEGLRLLIVSPVPHPIRRRARREDLSGANVVREIASLGGLHQLPLAESRYVHGLVARFEALSEAPAAVRDVARTLRERDTATTLGTWHGDWAPWNMTTSSDGLHVWDWERSADEVPVGLDALHYGFEVDYHRGSRSPVAALSRGTDRCRRVMESLGLEEDFELRRMIYVLERYVRTQEGHAAGVQIDHRLRDGLVRAMEE